MDNNNNNYVDPSHIGSRNMENHQTPKPIRFKLRPTNKKLSHYMIARVEKLRELYEEYTPDTTHQWVMPEGETDGRKAKRVETILGEDISPFDLPDFEERMPSIEDYSENSE